MPSETVGTVTSAPVLATASIGQPLRGIVPLLLVLLGTALFTYLGQAVFVLDAPTLSVYALYFVWTAFVISLSDRWPFEGIRQPYAGTILLLVALIGGALHPALVKALGFAPEVHWPLISNLFFGIGVLIAFSKALTDGLKQPAALALNTLFCYVLAIVVIQVYGMIPAIWFAWFVYVVFWLECWPVGNLPQPAKGILTFVIIGLLTLLLQYAFRLAGTNFFAPEAGLWFVLFVGALVSSSWQLETWPIRKLAQPLKGLIGLAGAIAVVSLSYYLIVTGLKLDPGIASAYAWVFVAWLYTWEIVFGKWPAERAADAR